MHLGVHPAHIGLPVPPLSLQLAAAASCPYTLVTKKQAVKRDSVSSHHTAGPQRRSAPGPHGQMQTQCLALYEHRALESLQPKQLLVKKTNQITTYNHKSHCLKAWFDKRSVCFPSFLILNHSFPLTSPTASVCQSNAFIIPTLFNYPLSLLSYHPQGSCRHFLETYFFIIYGNIIVGMLALKIGQKNN